MNKLIKLLLLVVMSFSIAHGVILESAYEENHCSLKEYTAEFSTPHKHDTEKEYNNDTCETHFMFHISFLLPDTFSLSFIIQEEFNNPLEDTLHPYTYKDNTFRPPIV